jgi:hypothetical protein
MEGDQGATLDPGNDLKVYSEREFAEVVAKALTEEKAKAQRQYKEEAAATSKARMEDIRWHERKIQQLEQQLRDRDSAPALNAFAQSLNEAAISALSGREVAQLYRQCSELSRQCSEALRLIGPRVEDGLQQSARGDCIDNATGEGHHEASTEAPYSRVAPIRKKRGKKLLDGLKGLWKICTRTKQGKRGSSFDGTFARIKGMSKSTLGLDKSSDDTAATDGTSTASPFKSTNMPSHDTLEPPSTPVDRLSGDAKTVRTRRQHSKKASNNVGPVERREAEEDGSTTETSLTDDTAGLSPMPARQRTMPPLQRPLIDTMAHPRRDAGLARA